MALHGVEVSGKTKEVLGDDSHESDEDRPKKSSISLNTRLELNRMRLSRMKEAKEGKFDEKAFEGLLGETQQMEFDVRVNRAERDLARLREDGPGGDSFGLGF
jgi:hypothetical protein